jgi:hypothetical protein
MNPTPKKKKTKTLDGRRWMWGFCSLIKMNLFFGGGGKGYLISIHMNLISKFLYLFKL